jgi:hypothetical protein
MRKATGVALAVLCTVTAAGLGILGTAAPAHAATSPCTAWSPLGGVIASDPVVVSNADGRLEVFIIGTDRALWHMAQTVRNTCDPAAWTGWSSLGGVFTSDPAAAVNSDGRLEVFARGSDNALWHRSQASPGSGTWGGWSSLGGVFTSDPAAAVNSDGRLETFARGSDNAIWHRSQVSPGSGTWTNWSSLGGVLTGGPAAAMNLDGRLELFARGSDNALWHRSQTSPGSGTWGGWSSLGGTVRDTSALSVAPAATAHVAANLDGRLDAFVSGLDRGLWHRYQMTANTVDNWSIASGGGWSPLAGTLNSSVTVGRNHSGRLEVFIRGTDNALWHRAQGAAGSATWGGWSSLGGVLTSDPTVAANADGRLEVFARGTDNGLWHRAQGTVG